MRSFILSLALPALLIAPGTGAEAAPVSRPAGGLQVEVLSCISGNTHVAARQGCRKVPGAGHESSQSSGLDEVVGLATSASRTSIYAVGNRNSALTQLSLARPSNAISFVACLSGDKFLDACPLVPGATSNAPEAPISRPTAAAISPDGRFLYVVSGNFHASVVARFARDPIAGTLSYEGCLTGDLAAGPTGPAGCAPLPTATRGGYGSGLYEPSGIAFSADGLRVYVTAAGDGGVVVFDRDAASGALTFLECVSSNSKATGCVRVGGGDPVLEDLRAPFISPDGRYLYAGAVRAGTVAAFALGGAETIRFVDCLGGRAPWKACRRGPRPNGPVAALSNPMDVAGSADGRFLYASSSFGKIVTLKRNRASGALTATSCISSDPEDRGRCARVPATPERTKGTHHATLLSGVRKPNFAPNGKTLLVPVRTIDGLVELRRNPKTGALTFQACATGNLQLTPRREGPCQPLPNANRDGVDSGFYKTTALVSAPAGLLYAVSAADATVFLLRP